MECPQGSREANPTRADGYEEKLDEIIRIGNTMEIQNISSENWIPKKVKL